MLWIAIYLLFLVAALFAWYRHWNYIEPHHKPDEHEIAFDYAHTPPKGPQATYRSKSA